MGRGNRKGKVQGVRNVIGRHKIDGERLRMVLETEKPKNICMTD